jgi:hypothetical protein
MNNYAQICQSIKWTSVGNVFNSLTCTLIGFVVPFLFALATVGFIWGVIQMFMNPDSEEKRKTGKQFMVWGLVGLFVMLSVWALVNVLSSTFFGTGSLLIPQLSQ